MLVEIRKNTFNLSEREITTTYNNLGEALVSETEIIPKLDFEPEIVEMYGEELKIMSQNERISHIPHLMCREKK